MGSSLALGLSYDGTFVTSDSNASYKAFDAKPGRIVKLKTREGYRYYKLLKAEEAFAVGQVAMISALLDNADVDAVAAIGATSLTGTGDFTANEFNDGTFPSSFVSIDANTGVGQTRAIDRNTADVLTIEQQNGWDTALDATSDYVTYDVNYVSHANTGDVAARASMVMGVAISAVGDEEWAWFQVGGFCPLVRCVGTTDPTIRGSIIVPSSTAGACKGPTAGGSTADEALTAFGMALHAHAVADSAGRGVAAILNCRYALIG